MFLTSPWTSSLYLVSCFWVFVKKQPGKGNFILKPIFPFEFHVWGKKHFLSHVLELYVFNPTFIIQKSPIQKKSPEPSILRGNLILSRSLFLNLGYDKPPQITGNGMKQTTETYVILSCVIALFLFSELPWTKLRRKYRVSCSLCSGPHFRQGTLLPSSFFFN